MQRRWLLTGGLVAGLIAVLLVVVTAAPVGDGHVDPSTDAAAPSTFDDGGGPATGAPTDELPDDNDARGTGAGSLTGDDGRSDAEVVAAPGGVLRVRLPRGFEPALVQHVGALPDILAVTVSRSDTVGLVGSRAADGAARDELRDGFQVPVGVDAIDPPATVATLAAQGADPEVLAVVAALEPGQALLTASSAEVRGLDVGGRIDLVGVNDLLVVGLVPDDDAGRTEIMVHREHAEALGMRAGRSLTVRHEAAPGAPTDQLVEAIVALSPDPDDVRITDLAASGQDGDGDEAASPTRAPLALGLPELKATFGEFAYRPRAGVREIDIDPAFVAEHIVSARVPLLGDVRCHRAIIDDVAAALGELVDAGFGSWVNPAQYGGCFHARRIGTDRDRLSTHSWGAAIDINVDVALPGFGPVPPDEVIAIFGRHGFRWGGDFTTPDHHHWEWVGERATERRDR